MKTAEKVFRALMVVSVIGFMLSLLCALASAQDVASDHEDTALVMARCVDDEVGPDLPKKWADYQKRIDEQTGVLWSLHNGWHDEVRKNTELTLSQYTRGYCTLYVKNSPNRQWIRELPVDGVTKPQHWPADDNWSDYAPRWRALLARVRAWLGPCGAELVTHWNGPGSKPRGRMQVARCSTFGSDRNVFFSVLTEKQARRKAQRLRQEEAQCFHERIQAQWGSENTAELAGGLSLALRHLSPLQSRVGSR